ncbi:hypothetical protein GQX74_001513 [Glossina fuscipes]|nr:hypothetical protein GQX74_001513 [Glossina fuscipes]
MTRKLEQYHSQTESVKIYCQLKQIVDSNDVMVDACLRLLKLTAAMKMLRLSSTTSMTYEVLSYKQVPSIVDKSLHMHHMCVDKLQNYSEQLTTHVGLSAYRFQTDFLHGPVSLSSAWLSALGIPDTVCYHLHLAECSPNL